MNHTEVDDGVEGRKTLFFFVNLIRDSSWTLRFENKFENGEKWFDDEESLFTLIVRFKLATGIDLEMHG